LLYQKLTASSVQTVYLKFTAHKVKVFVLVTKLCPLIKLRRMSLGVGVGVGWGGKWYE